MKKSNLINLEKNQRNSLLVELSNKLENPGSRHSENLDAEKYPILGYLMQDILIEEEIESLIMNN